MTATDSERWDAKYALQAPPEELTAPEWLVCHAADLPLGRALDLATGYGSAAIWLAERGWNVTAMDISSVGLRAAQRLAEHRRVTVNWMAADLDHADLGISQYDLVTVFRFLDRTTLPARIARTLRAGGRLIYQTFLRNDREENASHPRNPAFLLNSGELPTLFPDFEILSYDEQLSGPENIAAMVAVKL